MNSKAKFCKVILITLCLMLVSCGGVPLNKGNEWLESKKDRPEINISGTWVSPEWNIAFFKQQDKIIIGNIGDYPFKGVVSGNKVYLMMYRGEKADYFAELEVVDKDTLKGHYSKYRTIDEVKNDPAFAIPMSLRCIQRNP